MLIIITKQNYFSRFSTPISWARISCFSELSNLLNANKTIELEILTSSGGHERSVQSDVVDLTPNLFKFHHGAVELLALFRTHERIVTDDLFSQNHIFYLSSGLYADMYIYTHNITSARFRLIKEPINPSQLISIWSFKQKLRE